jgi:hypothetical protein
LKLTQSLTAITDKPAIPAGEQYEPAVGVALALDPRPDEQSEDVCAGRAIDYRRGACYKIHVEIPFLTRPRWHRAPGFPFGG